MPFVVSNDSQESRGLVSVFPEKGAARLSANLRVDIAKNSVLWISPVREASDEQSAGTAVCSGELAAREPTSIQMVRVFPLHRSAAKLNGRTEHSALVRVQFIRPIQPQSSPEPALDDPESLEELQTCRGKKTWDTSMPVFELEASSGFDDCRGIKQTLDSVIREGEEQELYPNQRLDIDTNLDLSGLLRNNLDYMSFLAKKRERSDRSPRHSSNQCNRRVRLSEKAAKQITQAATSL